MPSSIYPKEPLAKVRRITAKARSCACRETSKIGLAALLISFSVFRLPFSVSPDFLSFFFFFLLFLLLSFLPCFCLSQVLLCHTGRSCFVRLCILVAASLRRLFFKAGATIGHRRTYPQIPPIPGATSAFRRSLLPTSSLDRIPTRTSLSRNLLPHCPSTNRLYGARSQNSKTGTRPLSRVNTNLPHPIRHLVVVSPTRRSHDHGSQQPTHEAEAAASDARMRRGACFLWWEGDVTDTANKAAEAQGSSNTDRDART